MDIAASELETTGGPSPKRVWIVDDDESVLRLMTAWMTRAGHQVTCFSQFEVAKDYLTTTQPDVLITDVRLGAFNGLQLVVMGKLDHPEMGAVVLTGFDDPVLRQQASNVGASYLVKPINAAQLLETIQ